MSSKQVSKETMKYMTDGIRYICEKYKNRAPGTQSERDAQAELKAELEKYSDEVIMEDFELHPKAFMGFIPVAAAFGIISVVCYWLSKFASWLSIVSVVLMLLAVLMFLIEFLFYREFVDVFFPKAVSRNVYAVRKPKGEVKRRIIFGGHTDAAPEWTYTYHGGLPALAAVMAGAIIGMFATFGISLALMIKTMMNGMTAPELEGIWKVLGIVLICLIPFYVAIMFFINWKVIVDGANDNLTACYISMAVLKDMTDNDERFENTEVGCLLSGSEEAGLRGARAFARKHKKELQDVETVFIAMDTMREVEQLQIYGVGCTGTVHSSKAVGALLHEAGLKCGIDMPPTQIYPGAIDSDAFAQEGLEASGFCGVNHDPKKYYHTREDSWDNMSEECIELSLRICKECADIYDKKGGISSFRK